MSARICMKKSVMVLGLLTGALFSVPALAGDVEDAISKRLTDAVPRLQILSVKASEAKGLYEVQSNNGETVYTTADGQYLLTGDLLKLTDEGILNVTEESRARDRRDLMAKEDVKEAISFPAKGEEKAVISVFTDIDCPYCRKLHAEVSQLNEYGITVNYYGFPRSGPGTPSFAKYVSVWCSEDQKAAMDAAKQGKKVDKASCENPVLEQFMLGKNIGVTGTPAIVLEDGHMVRGYVPAESLAKGLGLL